MIESSALPKVRAQITTGHALHLLRRSVAPREPPRMFDEPRDGRTICPVLWFTVSRGNQTPIVGKVIT